LQLFLHCAQLTIVNHIAYFVKELAYMDFDAVTVRTAREGLLLRLLFRTTHTMNVEMTDRIRARGFADFQPSFTALLAHVDTEGTRITAIARRMGTSRQAASQLLQAIEARGYVERVPDPSDGRGVIVRHTASGRRILLTAIEVMRSIEKEYELILGPEGLTRLKRLLKRLLAETDPGGALDAG
jgi:DNA-binding MarR family transcriptional regulator